MKLAPIALLAAAGLAAAAFAGVFQPSGARGQSADDASTGGITVAGTGSVSVVPDRAGFTFGTVSQARTAAAALTASADSVKRVVDAVRQAGVARADIQTSEVSLSPRMDDNGSAVVGYTATNSVTVTVRRLASAGDVVDGAVGAGANQVYGPNLLAADQKAAYANALKAAVAEARTKAQALASSTGLTVGRITSIDEIGSTPQPYFSAAAGKDSAVQIEPGTQEIQATVSVTFAIS
jgi:uncharacterized protein YggE